MQHLYPLGHLSIPSGQSHCAASQTLTGLSPGVGTPLSNPEPQTGSWWSSHPQSLFSSGQNTVPSLLPSLRALGPFPQISSNPQAVSVFMYSSPALVFWVQSPTGLALCHGLFPLLLILLTPGLPPVHYPLNTPSTSPGLMATSFWICVDLSSALWLWFPSALNISFVTHEGFAFGLFSFSETLRYLTYLLLKLSCPC